MNSSIYCLLFFKCSASFVASVFRKTRRAKKANASITTDFMTTTLHKKRDNVLQFSAKKYWGIICISKNGIKKTNLDRFVLHFTQIQIGTITKIPWWSRLLTKDELQPDCRSEQDTIGAINRVFSKYLYSLHCDCPLSTAVDSAKTLRKIMTPFSG